MINVLSLFDGMSCGRIALNKLDIPCKYYASEIDKYARKTYIDNFQHTSPDLFKKGNFPEDIGIINPDKIPDFNILCAGFPCQPFSRAGVSKRKNLNRAHGFDDKDQGDLFFNDLRFDGDRADQRGHPQNQRDVGDVGPIRVAEGEARVALRRGDGGHHHLGRGRPETDDDHADHQRRQPDVPGYRRGTIDEAVSAPQEQDKPQDDGQNR